MAEQSTVSVYDYLDFRVYLADFYAANKTAHRGFSYRSFSRRAGLNSPNHLKLVTEGARRLTDDMVPKFARALKLDPSETSYFGILVALNQATTTAERTEAYRQLTHHKVYRKAHRVDRKHAAYYSRWYIPAIREMALQKNFVADPEWIAMHLIPRISEKRAAEALEVLYSLNLLHKEADGTVTPTDTVVVAEDATRGVHLATYHETMMNRAKEALSLLPGTARNVSAVTLCVDESGYAKIVERVQAFRKDLIAFASAAGTGTQVVHVGLQVFPLTSRSDDKTKPKGEA